MQEQQSKELVELVDPQLQGAENLRPKPQRCVESQAAAALADTRDVSSAESNEQTFDVKSFRDSTNPEEEEEYKLTSDLPSMGDK